MIIVYEFRLFIGHFMKNILLIIGVSDFDRILSDHPHPAPLKKQWGGFD